MNDLFSDVHDVDGALLTLIVGAVSSFHTAYKVVSAAPIVNDVKAVVAVDEVFHPLKVYPVLEAVGVKSTLEP